MTTAPTKPGYAGSGNILLESNNNTLDNGTYANNSSLTGGSITNTTTLDSGTYSTYATEKRGVSEADACHNSKSSTTGNYCNKTVCAIEDVWVDILLCPKPYEDINGNIDFVQLFVLTGCTTGKLQPIDMQPPTYQYPGVAANPFSTLFQN